MTEIKAAKVVIVKETDIGIFKECIELLDEFDVEVVVNSNLDNYENIEKHIQDIAVGDVGVIIAGYKKGSNFVESLAKMTNIPIIAVPIKLENDKGLDLLMPMFKEEESLPVATVAINGMKNAALLAVQILSISSKELREKMKKYRNDLKQMVEQKDKQLRKQYESRQEVL